MTIETKNGPVEKPSDVVKIRNIPGNQISPTGILAQGACDRMAWFKYMAGVIVEHTPKQQQAFEWGTQMHKTYEDFLLGNIEAIEDEWYKPAMPYLIDIRDALEAQYAGTGREVSDYVEREVRVVNDILDVAGFSDVIVPYNDRMWGVVDHKSTSHPKWAKTDLQAISDPQTLVYGAGAFQMEEFEGHDKIPVVYFYTQKPGNNMPPRSWPVKIEMNRTESQRRWEKYITPSLMRFRELEEIEEWEKIPLPSDTDTCHKHYGGPCPYKNICYGGAAKGSRFAGAGNVTVKVTRTEAANMNWKERAAKARSGNKNEAANQTPEPAAPAAPAPAAALTASASGFTLEELQALYLDGKRPGEGIDMSGLDRMVKLNFIKWMSKQSSGAVNSPEAQPNHEPEAILDGDGNEITEIQAAALPSALERVLLGLGCETFQDVAEKTSVAALLKTKGLGQKKVDDLRKIMEEHGVELPEDGGKAIEGDPKEKVRLTTDQPSFASGQFKAGKPAEKELPDPATEPTPEPAPEPPKAKKENVATNVATPSREDKGKGKGFGLLVHAMPIGSNENSVTENDFIELASDMNEGRHVMTAGFGGDKAFIAQACEHMVESGALEGKLVVLTGGAYTEIIATALAPHATLVVRGIR